MQYRNLRDKEALTLFKLFLTDQAQDWLYAIPQDQSDSFHRLQETFMKRYTPNPLQRYQKASHMWSKVQKPDESVDAYITAFMTAANQIQMRNEQQLDYCIIHGLRPTLRLHVLQKEHYNLEVIHQNALVATAGVGDSDKTVAELPRTVTLLVDKLTAKDTSAPPPAAPTVAVVTTERDRDERQQR
jgi:hypothetical protein